MGARHVGIAWLLAGVVALAACRGAPAEGANAGATRARPCRTSRACEAGERCALEARDANGFGVCAPGRVTAAQCAEEYPAAGGARRCRWVVEAAPYCGGAPPPEKLLEPGCLCRACLSDADCTDRPGGACVTALPSSGCGDAVPACAYPGDACHPSSPCAPPAVCVVTPGPKDTLRCGEKPPRPELP